MTSENAIIKTPVAQISSYNIEKLRDHALELELITKKLKHITEEIVKDVKINEKG